MAADEKWYFTKEQLANSPSKKCGIDADKELRYRQQAANFIQDMGQRLSVSQLCINTAIVYMHRFYLFHSLTQFHRNSIAAAALFLAAKVEEQPRKLEHVIKVAHMCLHRESHPPPLDMKSEQYLEQAQDLVFNENVLLQTLGFDVAIDHPHTHVVRCCQLVKASKDLAQTSYFMASNSLHLTTMCLQYKPTVVACFCIHLACKWSNWEIPQSNEGKFWFWYIDKSVTSELLGQLTGEFLHIFDKCPSRLKKKIRSISASQSPNLSHPSLSNSPFDAEPRKVQSPANVNDIMSSFQSSRPFPDIKAELDGNNKSSSSMSGRTSVDYREYREKKERERLEREKAAVNASSGVLNADPNKHHSHHHKQSMSSSSMPNKHSSSSSSTGSVKQAVHHNHHHSSRQDMKPSQMMPQRHSTGSSGQSRDSNRDRQRISREQYSSSSNASNSSLYPSHPHPLDSSLDTMLNNLSQDSQTVHPPEKLSNNVHKSHDSRGNDLRHNKQQLPQKDAKPYAKYADPASATSRSSSSSSSASRKPDILEQRSEEVRKLIEKPLPPPKPRAEVLKEEFAAMMLKQPHHPSKYGHQPEKPISSVNSTQAASALPMPEVKGLNVGQTAFTMDKSPNAPIPASQVSHKSLSLGPKPGQMMTVKNGNASSSSSSSLGLLGSLDDAKTEKRPRELDNSSLQTPPPQPATKHRSLFSPEKTPTPMPLTSRESSSHSQRSKQKQKASPAMPKQELPSLTSSNVETQQAKQRLSNSLSASTTPASSQKAHRGLSNAEILDQQLADVHSRKISSQSFADLRSFVDVKPPPELIKPFDSIDPMMMFVAERVNKPATQQHGMSNGMDNNSFVKPDYLMDPSSYLQVKPELPDELLSNEMPSDLMFGKSEPPKLTDYLSHQEPVKNEAAEPEVSNVKQDSYSPLKSAQSISALLAEPLAPMPSLLQVPSYEQQQQIVEENKSSLQVQPEPALPSTVDMSGLTGPIQCTLEVPAPTMTTTRAAPTPAPAVAPAAPVVEEKKPEKEHRSKSEKKKEKKKHKHKEKDKEKSKEKHKHKHKDKDKEKHHREKSDREKNNKTEESGSAGAGNASLGAVPIKITIPKDKINLSSESIGTSSTTSTSSSLKIKIPKERLKGTEVTSHQQPPVTQSSASLQTQAPLKIKIRTDAINRNSGGGNDLQSSLPTTQHQDVGAGTGNNSSSSTRKRDRDSTAEVAAAPGQPPAKKQQQPRPNERQNGRHSSYNSASSNKVRGGGRGLGPRLPPYPYQQYALAQHLREAGYHGYQQRHSPPPPPYLRHPRPPPPPHPYFANYHAMQAPPPPPVFTVGYTGAGLYDPAAYYQYQQQQQFANAMYPTGGVMMTAEGQIDTSVPPPSLAQPTVDDAKTHPPPPPLPAGPPPSSSPPPPPPPPDDS